MENPESRFPQIDEVLEQLEEMAQDGLIQFADSSVTILEKGKPFVRNICMAFDLRLKRRMPENRIFSMTILISPCMRREEQCSKLIFNLGRRGGYRDKVKIR